MDGETFPNIERKSPVIEINLGAIALQLTYENTIVYTFYPPYEHINHVVSPNETAEEIHYQYIFDSPDLVQQLIEFHYPEVKLPYPTEQDIESYIDYNINVLEDGESYEV